MTDFNFYFGAASGSERKAIRKLEPENVMISYSTMHRQPIQTVENHFYDSGAYSLFSPKSRDSEPYKEYPWSIEEYFGFMESATPQKFAVMDYVCEPEVRNYHNWTVERQQRKTTENAVKILNRYDDSDLESQPVTVIQGWKEKQYIRHLEQLRSQGLLTETIGIGTLCGRKDPTQIRDIVETVREELPRKYRLHGFGVKSDGFQFPSVRQNLDSSDSLASSMSARYNRNESDMPMWWRQMEAYVAFYNNLMNYFKTVSRPVDPAQKQLEVTN